jgi:hypothetical protein
MAGMQNPDNQNKPPLLKQNPNEKYGIFPLFLRPVKTGL